MKKISKINKIRRIENDLRQQRDEKEKGKNEGNLNFNNILEKEKRKLEKQQDEPRAIEYTKVYNNKIKIKQIEQIEQKEEHEER